MPLTQRVVVTKVEHYQFKDKQTSQPVKAVALHLVKEDGSVERQSVSEANFGQLSFKDSYVSQVVERGEVKVLQASYQDFRGKLKLVGLIEE